MSTNDDDDAHVQTAADLIAAYERAQEDWSRGVEEAHTVGEPGWGDLRTKFHRSMHYRQWLSSVLRCEGCLHCEGICYSLDTRGRLLRRNYKQAESIRVTRGVPDLDPVAVTGAREDPSC